MSTEADHDVDVVEDYYSRAADHYASTWDPGGRMHWGYFGESANSPASLAAAIEAWDATLCRKAGISAESIVLDLGCGTGASGSWLAKATRCTVVGVDRQLGHNYCRATIPLIRGDAMHLPFTDGAFSHVWCQAMLCHVPDRERSPRSGGC